MIHAQGSLNLWRKSKGWKGIFEKENNEKSEQKEIKKEKRNERSTVVM